MHRFWQKRVWTIAAVLALGITPFTIVLAQGSSPAYPPVSQLEVIPLKHPDFQTLRSFGERYGCPIYYADGTAIGNRSLTQSEFANAVRVCLDRLNATGTIDSLPKVDRESIDRLANEFSELSDREFSHTTRLSGEVVFDSSSSLGSRTATRSGRARDLYALPPASPIDISQEDEEGYFNREGYNLIDENPFLRVTNNPLSTFAIDVDSASYSNVRRFLNNGQIPPKDAVRIEELINYFTYSYPEPEGDRPFSISTESSIAPWNSNHKLVRVGLKGKSIPTANLPPSNLVFLLDVSGSMAEPNKLPLLKSAFRLLVNELKPTDRVSIVVYAGAAGVVLPPTPGSQKETILAAIENLQAGGSTAGGEGIQLAYQLAQENFLSEGNNRVILATDGDFNVGISSDAELVRLIQNKRDSDIFLTVLGFGTGNLQDAKMEQLANKGNGNYAYLDTILEAKKVLVSELGATLLTLAKDVKIQVEFNPEKVQAYRLIGYENRLLRSEDFNDDTKDAGELGAGYSVTALYEILPVGATPDVELPEVDELRYQQNSSDAETTNTEELMTVKLRYKLPSGDISQLIEQPLVDRDLPLQSTSEDFRFASSVAAFGMLLRDSQYKGSADPELVLQLANEAKGEDREGYRADFIRLVESYQLLASN
ncbi:MAG: von Willebrand factor type A domain-containing protein [Geitlerinemataceae cyanobacterium]